MLRHLALLAPLLLASAASRADGNCDAIRAQIDAKVRASGVADFALTVVDADAKADAKAEGKVVGSCALGARKIVYTRTPGTAAAPAPAPTAAAGARVLTECRDGSVTYGDCGR